MRPLGAPGTDLADILYKIVTPYIPATWNQALSNANLINSYPNLVHDLSFGSPIGNLPHINFTFIPNNLPSAKIRPEYITNLINEEVTTGCMDGPFTVDEAQCIYGGHFRTCPLWLVDKPGSKDLRMIRHFSKEDQFGQSMNSWVDSDNFPTCWFTAATVASFESISYLNPHSLCHPTWRIVIF